MLNRTTAISCPVEIAQVMTRKIEAGSTPCLFGNLRQAERFSDRRRMTVAIMAANRMEFEEDFITIRGTGHFDSNVHSVGNSRADEGEREAGHIVGPVMQPQL